MLDVDQNEIAEICRKKLAAARKGFEMNAPKTPPKPKVEPPPSATPAQAPKPPKLKAPKKMPTFGQTQSGATSGTLQTS